MINYKELGKMSRSMGAPRFKRTLRESLQEGHIDRREFSLRRCAEETIHDRGGNACGTEWVRAMQPGGNGVDDQRLLEAGGLVDTSTFSNITGQIVYSTILEAYNDPAFIWDQLVTPQQTPFNGEKIPGIGRIGDQTEQVDEGGEYPRVGVSQEYIETPETVKTGMILPVTKEAIFFDRTNILTDRASEVGNWEGVKREKECIDIATGQVNNYRRNGEKYNTYYASAGHGRVNKATNALVDWKDINENLLLFDGMTDWTTGEPVMIVPDTIIVPSDLVATVNYILHATQVRTGTSNASAFQTLTGNPLGNTVFGSMNFKVVSSPLIYSRTSSAAHWFIGQPKKAFKYFYNWDLTTDQRSKGTDAEFYRDIVMEYKVSRRAVAAVVDPLYMVWSTGAS